MISAHVETQDLMARLAAVIFNFRLDGENLEGHGLLYYQLDADPAQIIGWIDDAKTDTASTLISFYGLTPGAHSILFGLISERSSAISYGRICFEVQTGKKGIYSNGIRN